MRLVDWVPINQQKSGAPRCEPLIGIKLIVIQRYQNCVSRKSRYAINSKQPSPPQAQRDTMGFLSTAHTPLLLGIDPRRPSDITKMTGDGVMRQECVSETHRFTFPLLYALVSIVSPVDEIAMWHIPLSVDIYLHS